MQVETIRRITIQGSTQGVAESTAALGKLAQAQAQVAATGATTATVTDLITKRQLSAADAYRRQTLAVDAAAKMQDQLARATKIADAALAQGIITADQHAARINTLKQKYADAGAGAGGFAGMLGQLNGMLGQMGVLLGVGALVGWGRAIFNTAAELKDQAEQIGLTTEQLQVYRGVLELNGTTAEQSDRIFAALSAKIGEATNGSKQAQDAFRRLGLSAGDLNHGMAQAVQRFAEASLKAGELHGQSVQLADINDVLGAKLGRRLIPSLQDLAGAYDDVRKKAIDAGLVIPDDQLDRAKKAMDDLTVASKVVAGIATPAIVEIVQDVSNLAKAVTNLANVFNQFDWSRFAPPEWVQKAWAFVSDQVNNMYNPLTVLKNGAAAIDQLGTMLNLPRKPTAPGAVPDSGSGGGWKPPPNPSAGTKETLDQYIAGLQEAARLDALAVTEKADELAIIKGANVLQKERGQKEAALVKTYDDALGVLNAQEATMIRQALVTARMKAYLHQAGDEQNALEEASSVDADHRALILDIYKKEQQYGVLIGEQNAHWRADIEAVETAHQHIVDQMGAGDYIGQLKEEASLAGLSADAREREAAVLQAVHQDHIDIQGAQADEIRGLVALRQETERWRGVADDLGNDFQTFFVDVFSNGKDAFQNLIDSIKTEFLKMLAYLIEQAYIHPIIVNVVESLTGVSLGGGAASAVGGQPGLSGLSQIGSLIAGGGSGGGLLGGLSSVIGSGIDSVGSFLGFGTPFVDTTGITGFGGAIQAGSLFGTTTLGSLFGGVGLGSLASSLVFGNKNDAGIGGMGGAAIGGLIGSIVPGIGTIVGSLVGGLLGGGLGSLTGSDNKSSTAHLSPDATSFNLSQLGDAGTQDKITQAATQITEVVKALSAAGVALTNDISGVNIGNSKSYLYYDNGQKQKLGKANDVPTVVSAALDHILATASSTDANVQKVLDHYKSTGGITADNVQQVVSDLGFASSLANFDFGVKQLTQSEQVLKQISDQFDAAIQKAQELGLDTSDLVQAEHDAIQSVTDGFNKQITDSINQITNGPLASWNALIDQQNSQMDEAKAANADLGKVEQLQYLQRKQLLMSLDDGQRESLLGLIGLTDDLAAKTVKLQAAALAATNAQITAAQAFAQQQNQLAQQYGNASTNLNTARVGFLTDPNFNRLNPMDAYAASQKAFEDAAAKAKTGDLDALNSLGGLAQTFLQNSLAVNASSVPYGKDFAEVQDLLAAAQKAADDNKAKSLSLVDAANAQITALQNIQTELQKVDPNTSILNSMLDQLKILTDGVNTLDPQPVVDSINQLLGKTDTTTSAVITGAVATVAAIDSANDNAAAAAAAAAAQTATAIQGSQDAGTANTNLVIGQLQAGFSFAGQTYTQAIAGLQGSVDAGLLAISLNTFAQVNAAENMLDQNDSYYAQALAYLEAVRSQLIDNNQTVMVGDSAQVASIANGNQLLLQANGSLSGLMTGTLGDLGSYITSLPAIISVADFNASSGSNAVVAAIAANTDAIQAQTEEVKNVKGNLVNLIAAQKAQTQVLGNKLDESTGVAVSSASALQRLTTRTTLST